MEYEYTFLVETVAITPGIADLSPDEFSQELATGLGHLGQSMTKSIPTLPKGGWEIVSHSVTRIDRHLTATFLIRRPRG